MAYFQNSSLIGVVDITQVITAGNVGSPWVSSSGALPAVTPEQMLGQIIEAQNSATIANLGGGGEFIFLKIPTSTTVTPGLFYSWKGDYTISVVPTAVSSAAVSGFPIALAINTVASNGTLAQYTWFQVSGLGTAYRGSTTAVLAVNVPLFVSNVTAGKIRATASIFRCIIGIRSANTATISAAISATPVYLQRPCIGPGV